MTYCALTRVLLLAAVGVAAADGRVSAQRLEPVSRGAAVTAAITHGPRIGGAVADTGLAAARLLTARSITDPTLSASYTRDIPRYHVTTDLPLDFLWARSSRVQSATAAQVAARYQFGAARAQIALDADTTYTRALAAQARSLLSHRTAIAVDSLHRIASARRDAGDASDLDVELASVTAGQQRNLAIADSLAAISAILDLQQAMGLDAELVQITLTDSLSAPTRIIPATSVSPTLAVAAADASVESATFGLQWQRHAAIGAPSLMFGFDTGDPTGDTHGLLPTIGIAVPLPLFNRNRGAIAEAEATRQRAQADAVLARAESRSAVNHARRDLIGALGRIDRDQPLLSSAGRVASMSLTAYREGAATLASVLEAQRSAREVLAQQIDDVAAAAIAAAILESLTLTALPRSTP